MKKQIIAGIVVIACVALYIAVWPRSAEVGDLSAETVKPAVTDESAARPKEMTQIFLSADTNILSQ
jgi:hypothetical protein